MIRIVVIALCASGCTMGFGSAYVGQWRPHTEVVFDTCRADEQGHCLESKHVTTDVPARGYWGVAITFPAMGVSEVSQDGTSATRMRIDPTMEVLRGRGSLALGVRSGASIDVATSAKAMGGTALMIPIDVLGHLSLGERFGMYGGLGYIPYAKSGGETTSLGGRGIAGVQLALGHDLLERYIVLSLEANHSWLDLHAYHSTAVTTNIGVYF